MATEVLRDAKGGKIGEIITDSSGRQIIRDRLGRKKGEYDPRSNTTRDSSGRKVGTGNLLTRLI